MRGVVLFAMGTMTVVGAYGQAPDQFLSILGPRVGVSYVVTDLDKFTEAVSDFYTGGPYFPVTTLFGVIVEQRILLGQTNSHFAFQEVLLVSGLEQSIALPSLSILIGYRDASGFEIGAGPTLSLSGVGVVVGIGYTIHTKGVFIPVDVSVSLPSSERPAIITLTTGFNFVRSRSGGRR